MSFSSTLYLCPVLDLLLAKIPDELQAEIRLGLQEALVNAAKHGNQLDPCKTVMVQFLATKDEYCWVISDQGQGFVADCPCPQNCCHQLPPEESENGRGLCILNEIFDQVYWNHQGNQVRLYKQFKKSRHKEPILCSSS